MSVSDVPVQEIVRYIRGGSVHPFVVNGAFSSIEIVTEKSVYRNGIFPVELFGDVAPKFFRIIHGFLVHFLVLHERRNVRIFRQTFVRQINRFFGWHCCSALSRTSVDEYTTETDCNAQQSRLIRARLRTSILFQFF